MKSPLSFLILFLLSVVPIHAGNVRLPSDGAMKLQVTIPDAWKTSVDKDGVLSADSPDEELGFTSWAMDKEELAKLKDGPNKLALMLADCVTGIKIVGQPVHGQVGNVRTTLVQGTGIDVDDKEPVYFRALILNGGPGDVTVVYLAADSDVEKSRLAVFDQILRSVRPQ